MVGIAVSVGRVLGPCCLVRIVSGGGTAMINVRNLICATADALQHLLREIDQTEEIITVVPVGSGAWQVITRNRSTDPAEEQLPNTDAFPISYKEYNRAARIAAWAAKQTPPGPVASALADATNPLRYELVMAIAVIARAIIRAKDHG